MPFTGSEIPIHLEDKNAVLRRQYIGPGHNPNPNSTLNGTEGAIHFQLLGRDPMGYHLLVALLQSDDGTHFATENRHVGTSKIDNKAS